MTEKLASKAQVTHERRRNCCIKTKHPFQKKYRDCCGAVMVTKAVYRNFFKAFQTLVYTKTVDCVLIGYSNSEFPSPISHIQQHARDSRPKIL